jgi:uncharacterized protein (DUF2236 family)
VAVTRDQLEEHLDRIRHRVSDPSEGLYGPDSLLWQINREGLIFLGGGRAALLQEAHPFVAHGVDQHSNTRTDPQGRFKRTFHHVFAMVYGDLDAALTSARRVFAIHERIRGEIPHALGSHAQGAVYEANAEHALLWVHATLWDSSMQVYELVFGTLSAEDKERYYQETKLFAYLFGIGDDVLPPTWNDFVAYNERMWASDELAVDAVGREMQRFLFTPPQPKYAHGMRWFTVMTSGLLPARVREQYRLPFGWKERALFQSSIAALRVGTPLLPRQFRFNGGYQKARTRVGRPLRPTSAERWALALASRASGPGAR